MDFVYRLFAYVKSPNSMLPKNKSPPSISYKGYITCTCLLGEANKQWLILFKKCKPWKQMWKDAYCEPNTVPSHCGTHKGSVPVQHASFSMVLKWRQLCTWVPRGGTRDCSCGSCEKLALRGGMEQLSKAFLVLSANWILLKLLTFGQLAIHNPHMSTLIYLLLSTRQGTAV